MKKIKIGNKYIGENLPVFIIAEAGVNHNGSLKIAYKLIDAAVAAGADAVKFQTFRAKDVVTNAVKMAAYQVKNIGKSMSQLEMIKGFELKENAWSLINDYCKKKKIIFLSTPHGGFHSVDLLNSFDIPAFKISSGDLTNLPVLEYAAKLGKPMILGTGMSTLKEVLEAVRVIKKSGNNKIIILHCTTNYPCPFDEVNLNAMLTMKKKLGVLVGYSDHTHGIQVPIMATTLGACIVEKHFTLDKNMTGPDHKNSLDSFELKMMVQAIREVSHILGSSIKRPTKSEREPIKIARKSLVSLIAIKKGDKFNAYNIGIKRPGTGLAPKYYYEVIGKNAGRNLRPETLIKKQDYDN